MKKPVWLALIFALAPAVRGQTTVVQEAYIKASNTGPNDRFGTSIAYSGNTLIVGAPLEDSDATCINGDQNNNNSVSSGAAYIFVRSGSQWTQQAYVKSPDSSADRRFGASVAIHGDLAAVSGRSAGIEQVYLFERSGTSWSCHSTVSDPGLAPFNAFGHPIALSANHLVVGRTGDDSDATGVNGDPNNALADNSGAAYVFLRAGTTWVQEAYLKASNTGAGDLFGVSVAISGETIVIGAERESSDGVGVNPAQNNDNTMSRGAAYVFVRSGTTWAQQAFLKPTTLPLVGGFGHSVSISGDTIAVGAPNESTAASGINDTPPLGFLNSSGACYIYVRSGTTWNGQAFIKAKVPTQAGFFGFAVDVSGDSLVVGEVENDRSGSGINGVPSTQISHRSGAAYAFERTGTDWTQLAYIKAANPGPGEQFGWDVAASGSSIVVSSKEEGGGATGINGDPLDHSAGVSGACYAFDLHGILPGNLAGSSLCNGDGGDQMGCIDCPCSSNAAPGTIGGCLNSSGSSSRLEATGDPSVSIHHGAFTDLRFALIDTPPESYCVLLSGDGLAPMNMANPCFGISFGTGSSSFDGLRCSVGNLRRHGGRQSDGSGSVGVTNTPWGGEFNPQAGLAQAQGGFVAGQTRYFQAVYRDLVTMTCTTGIGTSQAIEIAFTP